MERLVCEVGYTAWVVGMRSADRGSCDELQSGLFKEKTSLDVRI